MEAGYDINNLIQEAQRRWLNSSEVLFILRNHQQSQQLQISREPLQRPASGSLILVDKRALKLFRNDGHNWRKKRDGKVCEGHEKLKVGNVKVNCYYGQGEQNPNFQRRIYWRLEEGFEHIVLVHYRDVTPLNPSPGPAGASTSLNPSANPTSNTGASSSVCLIPGSHSDPNPVTSASPTLIPSSDAIPIPGASSNVSLIPSSDIIPIPVASSSYNLVPVSYAATSQVPGASSSSPLVPFSNTRRSPVSSRSPISNQDLFQVSQSLCDILGGGEINLQFLECMPSPELFSAAGTLMHELPDILDHNLGRIREISYQFSHHSFEDMEIDGFEDHSSGLMLQEEVLISLPEKQIFKIGQISPEWGNDDEETKVMIIGSFLRDPAEYPAFYCMFGDIEVPVDIINSAHGVILCRAPRHSPGKVHLYITCGNRMPCSEIRQFDYRDNSTLSTMLDVGVKLFFAFLGDLFSSPPSGGGAQLEEMDDHEADNDAGG